ncbi:MAG: PIN domain-containing protein [Thermotogota bacterium]|nr:PIN domain-containing protein [Thermotogota bacterium]
MTSLNNYIRHLYDFFIRSKLADSLVEEFWISFVETARQPEESTEIEIENTPNIEKRNYLKGIVNFVHKTKKIQNKESIRAKQLERVGFKSFDAMHIACAESEKADVFLTTDDKLLKLAKRNKNKLNVDIVTFAAFFQILFSGTVHSKI